jgi:AcrR family transcriptional regulator
VFFDLPEALPRGQHGLSRERVEGIQRERLLRAFAEELAEGGYPNVRIARVCMRAGVSHATFYAQFSGKEECVCAAYVRYIEVVTRRAEAIGVQQSRTWREFMRASLDAYFDVLAADPFIARAFHIEMHTIGPNAGRIQRGALQAFAVGRMLEERRLRAGDPLLAQRPFSVHMGTVQVQRALARETLECPEPDFARLRDELLDWLVASWYGHGPRP